MRSKNMRPKELRADMTGQMLVVLELMDLYPRRARTRLDFGNMLFDAFNAKACPGDVFTVVERSGPRFHNDTTWYKVIAPSGAVGWVVACHGGVFYKAIRAEEP